MPIQIGSTRGPFSSSRITTGALRWSTATVPTRTGISSSGGGSACAHASGSESSKQQATLRAMMSLVACVPPAGCVTPGRARLRHPSVGPDRSRGGIFWSGRLDSNQRPLRPERSALPGCATPRKRSCTLRLAGIMPEGPGAVDPPSSAAGAGLAMSASLVTEAPRPRSVVLRADGQRRPCGGAGVPAPPWGSLQMRKIAAAASVRSR